MRLREFILVIASVVQRLALVRCRSHRQLFIDLSPVLISAQDRGLPSGAVQLLSPYSTLMEEYVRALQRGGKPCPEVQVVFFDCPWAAGSASCIYSPVLQLGRLVGLPCVGTVTFSALPRTSNEVGLQLRSRIGLSGHFEEPATFKTVLGFSLGDYGKFLGGIRRSDPVLFNMLLANEFQLRTGLGIWTPTR